MVVTRARLGLEAEVVPARASPQPLSRQRPPKLPDPRRQKFAFLLSRVRRRLYKVVAAVLGQGPRPRPATRQIIRQLPFKQPRHEIKEGRLYAAARPPAALLLGQVAVRQELRRRRPELGPARRLVVEVNAAPLIAGALLSQGRQ